MEPRLIRLRSQAQLYFVLVMTAFGCLWRVRRYFNWSATLSSPALTQASSF
jgi:hypothetical protein